MTDRSGVARSWEVRHDPVSDRPSGRDGNDVEISGLLGGTRNPEGRDSADFLAADGPLDPRREPWRFTVKRPATSDLEQRLSERDWLILSSVRGFRFLTTRQIARQHFGNMDRTGAVPRSANLALVRLRELGMLTNLERRIGGVRAGSGGFVWQLTERGDRVLAKHLGQTPRGRTRPHEPGTSFLDHTLAIAEVVLTLQEAASSGRITLSKIEPEPDCWRSYLGPGGVALTLKPDIAAVTVSSDFEDHWFFEVDRATEPPNRVVKKCLQYQEYLATGLEQDRLGLFPAIVWAVPSQRRRDQLLQRLQTEASIDRRLFTVVIPEDIEELVVVGAAEYHRRQGGGL